MHSTECRNVNSSHRRSHTLAELRPIQPKIESPAKEATNYPLSILPLGMVIRSFLITSIYSSSVLQDLSLRILWIIAHSDNAFLHPDKNPILNFLLRKSFYAQFCAGETPTQVQQAVLQDDTKGASILGPGVETSHDITADIIPWANSIIETINMADPGNYVALKLSGAGRLALYNLSQNRNPSPYLSKSLDEICNLARQRDVSILVDAEHDAQQEGIDSWTMIYARRYNTDTAIIYGTYQAYRRVTPTNISRHLAEAQEGGFTLGVKLVRGAYLGSDPRECLYDTKAETDNCYNAISESILTRQWSSVVRGNGNFPDTHLVLATHNAESVHKARAICNRGEAKSGIVFAQLQGMADELGCELIQAGSGGSPVALPAYKYLVWGSTSECMRYLLRRAYENRDAVQRTHSGRKALWSELIRRFKLALSLPH
ncbi:hypothetical protein NXS19_002891 [Fusarium pseudograminearum]|nr:hypothetical protein NXS19_002891 [Fusarium pseudograminearum]